MALCDTYIYVCAPLGEDWYTGCRGSRIAAATPSSPIDIYTHQQASGAIIYDRTAGRIQSPSARAY